MTVSTTAARYAHGLMLLAVDDDMKALGELLDDLEAESLRDPEMLWDVVVLLVVSFGSYSHVPPDRRLGIVEMLRDAATKLAERDE